jgi:nucleoporin SEH1
MIQVVQLNPSRRPTALLVLDPASSTPPSSRPSSAPPSSITSVAWAPSCGRSYHLLATGSRDGVVRVWKLTPPPLHDEIAALAASMRGAEESAWKAGVVAEFNEHSYGRSLFCFVKMLTLY